MVKTIGHIQVPGRIQGHVRWVIKASVIGRPIHKSPVEPVYGSRSATGDGGHHPVRADVADAIVEGVGDVDVALAVERKSFRPEKACGISRAINQAPVRSRLPASGYSGHRPASGDHPDAVVNPIADIQVAIRVGDNPHRIVEL